jgi:hypothetical protein
MLSLIEVQCPHCGAQGQIMVPPIGSIIIGPCPQCKELVAVFCGQVLPLDKFIMESGSVEERHEHLVGILTDFLHERIGRMLTDEAESENDDFVTDELTGDFTLEETDEEYSVPAPIKDSGKEKAPISQSEFDRFTDVDLKLLDNKAYFKSVFDG